MSRRRRMGRVVRRGERRKRRMGGRRGLRKRR